MNANLRDRPVFVCGHPKSGTSLVRSLLDSHPELVVYPEETLFFRRYLPKAQGQSLERKLSLADEYLIHFFEWNLKNPPAHQMGFLDRDYSDISMDAVRRTMRQYVTEGYRHDGDILSAAVLAFGKVSGQLGENSVRWVEKTPLHEYYAEQIFTWWPEALFIQVVRDPRDNYVSYGRKHKDWTARTFAESWSHSTSTGLAWQASCGPDRYRMLRYETLISSPAEVLADLCHFLGISDHPTLKSPTRNGKPWEGNSMFSEQFSQISSSPGGRWKKSMSADDLVILEGLARKPMLQMGYALSGTRLIDANPGAVWQLARASLRRWLRKPLW